MCFRKNFVKSIHTVMKLKRKAALISRNIAASTVGTNFVKATFLENKSLNSRFDENFSVRVNF